MVTRPAGPSHIEHTRYRGPVRMARMIDVSVPVGPGHAHLPRRPRGTRRARLRHGGRGGFEPLRLDDEHAYRDPRRSAHPLRARRPHDRPGAARHIHRGRRRGRCTRRAGRSMRRSWTPSPSRRDRSASCSRPTGRRDGDRTRRRPSRTSYTALTLDAARWLADRHVKLVGTDFISIEGTDDPTYPVHRMLLGAGIVIVEGLDLRDVKPGPCRFTCSAAEGPRRRRRSRAGVRGAVDGVTRRSTSGMR